MATPNQALPDTTIEAIRAICHKYNAELLDYTMHGRMHSRTLEIVVDNVDGVTLSLCENISRDLERELENDPVWSNIARLNVSSPGIERPLQFHWQYPKHVGRLLTIRLTDGTTYTGRLRSASEYSVTIDSDGEIVSLPFSNIATAHVELEW